MAISCLLIEDDEFTSIILRDYLELSGFAVDAAYTLEAGLVLFASKDYDAVLLDLCLAPSSPASKTVERIPELTKKPVLVLTGRDDDELGRKATEKGAIDFLVKGYPGTIEALPDRIKSAVEQYDEVLQRRATCRKLRTTADAIRKAESEHGH